MRSGLMVGGIVAGLGLGELLARWSDGGAFSHLHIYQHDEVLGTTLVPGEGQWISPGRSPRTWVEVNARGFRGEAWPEPAPGEVLIVGDSQVFGLGVDNRDTMPVAVDRHLTQAGWTHVLNGGVPTYGPEEYLRVADRILQERPVRDLVLVFNLANDLFELEVPNLERHAVWDGWAVRSETAPAHVTYFPGRAWLYRRSHLFFAMRKAWHSTDPALKEGLPSEGGVQTVVRALTGVELDSPDQSWREDQANAYRKAVDQLAPVNSLELLSLYRQTNHDLPWDDRLILLAVEERAHPGDIVHDRYAESSRRIEVTAAMLQQGARMNRDMPRRMDAWLARNPRHPLADRVRRALGNPGMAAERDRLAREIAPEQPATPLEDWIDRAAALGKEHQARVHIVFLPLDVQVSDEEFAKYGAEPIDLSASRGLIDTLVETTKARGVHAISLLAPLEKAEPGAFLDGDLHLTAKGHDAVGAAIAEALQEMPAVWARPGMPDGRSRVPLDREFDMVGENRVTGSSKLGCETKEIREWLRVRCFERWAPVGNAIDLSRAPGEAFAVRYPTHMRVYLPMFEGRDATVGVPFEDGVRDLQLRWEGGRSLAFVAAETSELDEGVQYSAGRYFGPVDACVRIMEIAECVEGIGAFAPECPPNTAHAGAAGWCLPVCDEHRPCEVGACSDWQGVDVCL